MQKYIDVIWPEKIQLFLGVHLASEIGGYAILSNVNGNARVVDQIEEPGTPSFVL